MSDSVYPCVCVCVCVYIYTCVSLGRVVNVSVQCRGVEEARGGWTRGTAWALLALPGEGVGPPSLY